MGTGLRFEDFYAGAYPALVVQLTPYLDDPAEAQDVVQEAFCRAWRRWDRIARYNDPTGWVRRVAWNLATSRWRRIGVARSHARRQPPVVVDGPGPDRIELRGALTALVPNHRRAVVLHHLVGLSVAEIARDCGVAEGTVKSWLHRGRAALAARLATDH